MSAPSRNMLTELAKGKRFINSYEYKGKFFLGILEGEVMAVIPCLDERDCENRFSALTEIELYIKPADEYEKGFHKDLFMKSMKEVGR